VGGGRGGGSEGWGCEGWGSEGWGTAALVIMPLARSRGENH